MNNSQKFHLHDLPKSLKKLSSLQSALISVSTEERRQSNFDSDRRHSKEWVHSASVMDLSPAVFPLIGSASAGSVPTATTRTTGCSLNSGCFCWRDRPVRLRHSPITGCWRGPASRGKSGFDSRSIHHSENIRWSSRLAPRNQAPSYLRAMKGDA